MSYSSPKLTICEILRELKSLPDITQDVSDKLAQAIVMAKKMDAKLREYKADWSEDFFEPNPNFPEELLIHRKKG